jgi:iron complex outermembrane receptor protein
LQPATASVGSGHSEGAEIEFKALPIARVHLSGSVSYTETRFDNYVAEPAAGALPAYDRTGQAFPEVPKWAASVIASYSLPLLNEWALTPQVVWRYVGNTYTGTGTTAAPFLTIPSYNVTDAQLSLGSDHWNIAAYVNNLADNRYITYPQYGLGAVSALGYQSWARFGEPRQFAVRVTARF